MKKTHESPPQGRQNLFKVSGQGELQELADFISVFTAKTPAKRGSCRGAAGELRELQRRKTDRISDN